MALSAIALEIFSAIGINTELIKAPPRTSSLREIFGSVVIAPLSETWLLGLTLSLFAKMTPRPLVTATAAAFLWGVLHGLVGWLWFFGTVWSFFIFSCAFIAWRKHSYQQAFIAAAIPHALINLSVMLSIATEKIA
ncbi:hypothetical protein ACLBKS_04825 [Hylemonella sp. W303a]|uniref:hypothetical protein n=1 Tax=Hylemonella sp. W303a TaxID=3389873 RepID=UPI00396B2F61